MATPAGKAKAQALNAKLEGEARVAIDELERKFMRTQAKAYHTCAGNIVYGRHSLAIICSKFSHPLFLQQNATTIDRQKH
jgi:hypothetical protein